MLSVCVLSFAVVRIKTPLRNTSTFMEVAPPHERSACCTPLTLYPLAVRENPGSGVGVGVGVGVGEGDGEGVGLGEGEGLGEDVGVGVGVGLPPPG